MPTRTGSYVSRNLMPGETVVAATGISPAVLIGPAVGFFVGLAGAFAASAYADQLGTKDQFLQVAALAPGGLIALGSAATWLSRWVERQTTEFVCTDRRILIKSGLLATDLKEIVLSKVEAMRLDQGLLGKVLGYASLKITGSGGSKLKAEDMEGPGEFYKCVQAQVNDVQHRWQTLLD